MKYENELYGKIEGLESELSKVGSKLLDEMEEFVRSKVAEGFKLFVFHSSYVGNLECYDDEIDVYLFEADVEVPAFESTNFTYSSSGESDVNLKFRTWLESIPESKYIVIKDVEESMLWMLGDDNGNDEALEF